MSYHLLKPCLIYILWEEVMMGLEFPSVLGYCLQSFYFCLVIVECVWWLMTWRMDELERWKRRGLKYALSCFESFEHVAREYKVSWKGMPCLEPKFAQSLQFITHVYLCDGSREKWCRCLMGELSPGILYVCGCLYVGFEWKDLMSRGYCKMVLCGF